MQVKCALDGNQGMGAATFRRCRQSITAQLTWCVASTPTATHSMIPVALALPRHKCTHTYGRRHTRAL